MSDFIITSTTDSEEETLAAAGKPTEKSEKEGVEAGKPAAPSESAQEGEHEEPDQPKRKGGFQKRIDRLTREKNDLEARLARLEAAAVPKKEEQAKKGAPDAADFETQAEFVAALVKYTLAESQNQNLEVTRQEAIEKAKELKKTTWDEQMAAAHEAHPDLAELLEEDLPVSPAMQDILVDSEIGGELLFLLASDPDECKRIAKLGPLAAAKAMGVHEAALLAKKPKEGSKETKTPSESPAKVSAAKKPISPANGAKGSGTTKSPDDMSLEEYRRWREANS